MNSVRRDYNRGPADWAATPVKFHRFSGVFTELSPKLVLP
jgi:hypothetical protein